jgi:DnaJ domain
MRIENGIILSFRGADGPRCLSCGTTENMGRRRYCSIECRQRLRYKLNLRTGLLRALNIRYATFCFSDIMIVMDMLPYASKDVFSFSYPRSAGKQPADDFSSMADILGDSWWAVKKKTNKHYMASQHLFEQADRNRISRKTVKPQQIAKPAIKDRTLSRLCLDRLDLNAPELDQIIKNAYRQQAKRYHPDVGGDNASFRLIQQAYEELNQWVRNPSYIRHRGFVDKWFYEGEKDKWLQPTPLPRPNRTSRTARGFSIKRALPVGP